MKDIKGRPSRSAIYQRLDYQIHELHNRFGGLPSHLEASSIWRDIWYEEAHNSTAIEGNTLVLKQVQVLLNEGRAVGGKQLKEYMEVRGYADAAEWVYIQAVNPDVLGDDSELITIQEVRRIHHLALQPVWDVAPHPDATDEETPEAFDNMIFVLSLKG